MGKELIQMHKLLKKYYRKILRKKKNNNFLYLLFNIWLFRNKFKSLIYMHKNKVNIILVFVNISFYNLLQYIATFKFFFSKYKRLSGLKIIKPSSLKKKKLNFIKKNIINKVNFFYKKTLNNYFFTITNIKYGVVVTKSVGHFLKKPLNIKKRRRANVTLKLFIKFFKRFIIRYKKKYIFNKFFFLINNYIIFKYIKWVVYTLLFSKLYINEIIYIIRKAHNGTRKRKLRKL